MAARKLRWRKDGLRHIPLQEAVWQFLLDHVVGKADDGYYVARFSFKNREGFERSLQGRIDGKYRYSQEDLDKFY